MRYTIWAMLAVTCWVSLAAADWDPGDGHKMHFPQLPDPNGWGVEWNLGKPLADDWTCTQTGPVTDIHLWYARENDGDLGGFDTIGVQIYADDRSGPYSQPGDLLWEYTFTEGDEDFCDVRLYGQGDQGWYDPAEGWYEEHNHQNIYQLNITDLSNHPNLDPFIQQEGEIYWLSVDVYPWSTDLGWKTSLDHHEDDAVWYDPADGWQELLDPITGESLDLAFVITPEPATLTLLGLGSIAALRRRRC